MLPVVMPYAAVTWDGCDDARTSTSCVGIADSYTPLANETRLATTVYGPGVRFTSVSFTLSARENPAGPVTVTAFEASPGSPTTVMASDPVLGAEGPSLQATINDASVMTIPRAAPGLPIRFLNMRRINIATDGLERQHSGNA
jgi:hypothetical protein